MPPFVGVAVKVTLVPVTIAPLGFAAIDTEGVTIALAVPVTQLEVAPVFVKLVGVPVRLLGVASAVVVKLVFVPPLVPSLNL